MYLLLTSSPCVDDVPEGVKLPCVLNGENHFIENCKKHWKPDSVCLIISSNPKDFKSNDEMVDTFEKVFNYHGLTVSSMTVLDNRNRRKAAELVQNSDMILLAGGHVPTQHEFFEAIALRNCLADYQGVVMGISAGTMNCADIVYAQPEMPGESVDPAYQRFLK